jgi:hypothetical protein
MKTSIFAITVLFLMLISSIAVKAGSTDIIDVSFEYFGPAEDINHDGDINYLDASLLVSNYGNSGPPGWVRSDINKDGIINYLDASAFVSNYGLYWLVP